MLPQPAWIKHSKIIEKLRYEASNRELPKKIKDCLGLEFSNSTAFQLKMEIKRQDRLSKKPLRISDYINDVESYLVTVSGVEHYLEEFSEKYLMQLCRNYGGRYTVGVQERVIKFIKDKKTEIEKNQELSRLNCFPIDISELIKRKESRIYFGVKAEAFLVKSFFNENTRPTIDFCTNESIQCITQNLSVNGLRLRTSRKGNIGDVFLIRYTGLEKEIRLQHPYICYRLIKCEPDMKRKGYIWFLEKKVNRYHADFNRYLSKLVDENHVRNKVDTVDLERFVLNNLAEQYFTNRQEELVLFLDKNNIASHAYGSHISKMVFNFFNTSKGNVISTLVEKDNITEISRHKPAYWIVKKDKNENFHSSVLCKNLIDNLFFKMMMKEDDVMLFKVGGATLDHQNDIKQEGDDNAINQRTKQELQSLAGMLILKPLPISQFHSLTPTLPYEKLTENHSAFCPPIGHDGFSKQIEFTQSEVGELRGEQRFVLDGPVVLKNDYGEFDGVISNISPKGLSVILKNEAECISTSTVYVSFPEIKSKIFNDTYFKYKVMEQRRGLLRLFASPDCKPNASKFLGSYLRRIGEKLKLSPERSKLIGFESSLRSLYNASIPSIKGLVSPYSKSAHVTHMNINKSANLQPVFENVRTRYQDCKNLKNLMLRSDITHLLFSDLKNTPIEHSSSALVCIGFNPESESLQIIAAKTWKENDVDYSKAKKLDDGLKERGALTAWFQVSVARKSRISSVIHLDEYRKLETLSPHKIDYIDKLVRNTIDVFDMTPIDDWLEMWG